MNSRAVTWSRRENKDGLKISHVDVRQSAWYYEYNTSIAGPICFNLEPKIKRLKKTISLKKRTVKANQLSQNCFLVLVKGVANNPHVNKTFMENKKNPAAATISTTLPSVAGC